MASKQEIELANAAYRVVLRETLQSELMAFIRYFYPVVEGQQFIINEHHTAIVEALMMMYEGNLPDGRTHLMINMPPRYGKTVIMCFFVAWLFARHPNQKVMHLSCSDSLVIDNTKLILRIMKSDEFQALWPTPFVQMLEHNFVLEAGGSMYSSSTGGEVIGKGCGSTSDEGWGGFLWVDDPLKPADAISDTVRGKVVNLCDWAHRTRRNNPKHTPTVQVMQRLHDSDPAGVILDSESAKDWHLLKMKALRDDGSALWPHKHTAEDLMAMRDDPKSKDMFWSQYQQEPVPDDGEFFKESDARYYSKLPDGLEYYICSDIALSAGKGDYTEHAVYGVDSKDNIFIVDWWSGQVDDVDVVESLVALTKKWRPRFLGNEGGPTWKAIEGSLKKRLIEERCYVPLEVVSAAGDKTTKANTFQGLWRFNKVFLPNQSQWASELLHQMKRFPKGKYDDKVDALSVFGRLINKVRGGQSEETRESRKSRLKVVSSNNKQYGWMAN